jgi:hypothetical protein
MRCLYSSLLFALASCLFAQEQVKITDATALATAPDVRKDKAAVEAIRTGDFSNEEIVQILQYGDRDQWPEGIRTETARLSNEAYIVNYACFRLAAFREDTTMMALLMVPAASNLHMPDAMRPLADFYLVVPENAVRNAEVKRTRPAISRGPHWTKLPKAKIIKPDELYGAYDLASDSAGLEALAKRGMSRPEIDAVIFRSTETNWPDGIESLTKRAPLLPKFPRYHAYLAARWDDKVLLIIPVEKNRRMPVAMRPFVDLYFVYKASAVKYKSK